MKEKKRKQIAFEIHKQNNLLPKLNLPLNLKTEKARQSRLNIQSKKLMFYKLWSPHSWHSFLNTQDPWDTFV